MALQAPILNPIVAFDATQNNTFKFDVIGGDSGWQGVIATILNNTDDTEEPITVFTSTIGGLSFTIGANTLSNGNQYQITIQTTMAEELEDVTSANSSPASKFVNFYCYTTPTWNFTNVSSGGSITGTTYPFQLSYAQIEGERLSQYRVILYNENNVVLKNSGWLNAPAHNPVGSGIGCIAEYTFSGFLNGQTRRIEALGITSKGTNITTGKITFQVQYEDIVKYTEIYARNQCETGSILVGNTMDVMRGYAFQEPIEYYSHKDSTQADLRNNGVSWINVIDAENFNVFLQFRAPIKDIPHLILTSGSQHISETTFDIEVVEDKFVYNYIVATTKIYDDNGEVVETIISEYDLSSQEIPDVNYTTDATVYGFNIKREDGEYSAFFTMLNEPIEGLDTQMGIAPVVYDYEVIDTTGNGNIKIIRGFPAVDTNDGNISLSNSSGMLIEDTLNDGNITIKKQPPSIEPDYLIGVYLSDDRGSIPITFKLGDTEQPKDTEDLIEGDTYLWAISDSIDITEDNFEIIGDILYYYPDGKED